MSNLTSTLTIRLLDQVTAPARKVAGSILGIGDALDRTGRTLGVTQRLEGALNRNNRALARTRGQLLDAVGGAYALRKAFGGAVGSAMSFESALADVAKVSGLEAANLDLYGRQLRKLATTEIPMAVNELAALSAAAAQSGVSDDDLLGFTRITAKSAVAWEMSGAAAGEALAKIRTQLGLTNDETGLYADAINHLSNTTASAAPDLIEYSRRVAAQGEFFGMAANETLAFGSAMIAAGADSNVAATSFRNMGRALTKGESATKRQRNAYRALGLDAANVARRMQADAMGTTLDVMGRISAQPEHTQAAAISDLFGDEARALAPLLGNLDQLRRVVGLVADQTAYAGSVNEEFARRTQTTEYIWQRFKNQVTEIGLAIGNSLLPPLREAMGILGPIASRVAALVGTFPGLTRNVLMATGGLIALRVGLIGIRWAALMARGGLLSLALPVARMGTWARNAATSAVALQTSLATASGVKYAGLTKAGTALAGIARAVPGIGLLSGMASGIAAAVGALTLPAWGTIAIGVAAIGTAGALVYRHWDRLAAIFSGVASRIGEELTPAIDTIRPVLDWFAPIGTTIATGWTKAANAISGFLDWIGNMFSREILSEDAKASFEQAGYEAADRMIQAIKEAFKDLVSWFVGLGSQIGDAISGGAMRAIGAIKGMFGGGDTAAPKPIEGRAAGGPVRSGHPYLVGERGPELAVFGGGGRIIPNSQTMALLRASRGGIPSTSSAGRSGGTAGASITVHAPITVTGISDPAKAAKEVVRLLDVTIGASARGIHADIGVD